jgi:hypothetical protein
MHDEIDTLLALKRVTTHTIQQAKYAAVYLQVQAEHQFNNMRQLLLYVKTGTIPKCYCGADLQWKDTDYRTYCSTKCSTNSPLVRSKTEATCTERFGTTSPAQNDSIKEKMKRTTLAKYGVEHISQCSKIKEQKIQTSLAKYGTTQPLLAPIIHEKTKKTMLAKYGATQPSHSPVIRNKTKQTCLTRYGVENPFQMDGFKQKAKETNIAKYNVDHHSQHPTIKNKIKETIEQNKLSNPNYCLEINEASRNTSRSKYGTDHHRQRAYNDDTLAFLSDMTRFTNEVTNDSIENLAITYNISPYPIYTRMKQLGLSPTVGLPSMFETEILTYVQSLYTGTVKTGDRSILAPKELDIYVPDISLAIECNGAYWHSELNGRGKYYHANKTNDCAAKNIRLIHIWQHQWVTKKPIVESMVMHTLGKSKIIYARKCEVQLLTPGVSSAFFDANHIQGSCSAMIHLGLHHNGELVSCMSFSKPRYNKKYEWELIRFASKCGHTVTGGASKLFSFFTKTYSAATVISYSDRSRSTGKVYSMMGFDFVNSSAPNYYYTQNYNEFFHRSKFQKHKLANLLTNFVPTLTEWENMQNNGYDRIWDCGNDVWVWKR